MARHHNDVWQPGWSRKSFCTHDFPCARMYMSLDVENHLRILGAAKILIVSAASVMRLMINWVSVTLNSIFDSWTGWSMWDLQQEWAQRLHVFVALSGENRAVGRPADVSVVYLVLHSATWQRLLHILWGRLDKCKLRMISTVTVVLVRSSFGLLQMPFIHMMSSWHLTLSITLGKIC